MLLSDGLLVVVCGLTSVGRLVALLLVVFMIAGMVLDVALWVASLFVVDCLLVWGDVVVCCCVDRWCLLVVGRLSAIVGCVLLDRV